MDQDKIRYMSIAMLAMILTIDALCIATPVMAEVSWVADPFEELRDEYFMDDQPSIEESPITHAPETNVHNSTLALCFEYSNGSLVVIPFDDIDLANVSLRVNGTEVAKYPADDILKVVKREMKDIIERMSTS